MRAQRHGFMTVSRRNPHTAYLYSYKRTKQHRVMKNHFGQRAASKHRKYNAKRNREPWVLASSLDWSAKAIIRLYKTRMQIEEAFRDIKNTRWGLGLSHSKTYIGYRFDNLLLIGALATWVTWLVGQIVEAKGWHRHYQANTTHRRKVLSTLYLGCEVLKVHTNLFSRQEYRQALKSIRQTVQQGAMAC